MPNLQLMQMPPLPAAAAVAIFYRQLVAAGLPLAALIGIAVAVARKCGWRPRRDPLHDRRLLVLGLGALWSLDGLLQMQPLMVTRFLSGVVAPLLQGEPVPLAAAIRVGIQVWGLDPIAWNVVASLVQLLIGAALLVGSLGALRRAALWTSAVWGLAVWLVGEAMGGLFVGGGWLSGAPGAVLIYVAGAAAALLPDAAWRSGRVHRFVPVGMSALLILNALLQAWPPAGFWAPGTLAGLVSSMGQMAQPALLAAPVDALAAAIPAAPALWNLGIVTVLGVLGVAWLVRPDSRLLLIATTAWIALTWYFGQEFGVLGGMGTDPNIGAVLLLWLGVYARGAETVAIEPVAEAS
jgi:hypothetical protein